MVEPVKMSPAWQRNDTSIIKDATDFWLKLRVLPAGVAVEQRAQELCAAAYVGSEIVGVSTIALRHSPTLRCRLGFFRCLVSPTHSDRRLARRLTIYSRELLEQWSRENPGEKVLGMAAILENANFDLLATRPIWHAADLRLIGYTPNGQQIRLTWFDHARLERA
jgi:hypothetical protein